LARSSVTLHHLSLSLGLDLQVHSGLSPVAFPVTFPLPGFAAQSGRIFLRSPCHHIQVIAFLATETLRDSVSDRSKTTWATMVAGK
jgi:hypothetical protein